MNDDSSPFTPCTDEPTSPALTEAERLRVIVTVLEQHRPMLQRDGGDLELAGIEGHKVKVRLTGACSGCGAANTTLGMIRRTLMHALGGGPVLVVPVP